MNSFLIAVVTLSCYTIAYRVYGRFLSKNYGVDPKRKTPAHEKYDGIDYVPVKNWWILFGHHFSSICGAGPIVGPVLACAYWGWGVSVVWIVIGAILMGAVADFSSLMISIRHEGKSIAEVGGILISKRVRFNFSIFLWISLILVNAVFVIFAAKTFIQEPDAVIPSFGLIPTALLTGWLLYRTKVSDIAATVLGLAILVALLYIGTNVQVEMPALAGLSPQTLWILILLVYCFCASVMPVQVLLQPRDYLASFILFALISIGVVSILVTNPAMQSPAWTSFNPQDWPTAGPLWPMLFVTIACGAISGFHSLVSSGTTCKQIASEAHACRVGYGGMLVESLVGVLVLISVTAGLSRIELAGFLKSGGPIAAFSHGYGEISKGFLGAYGKSFAVLALNAFILTTLDTATRITRYLTSELFGVKNIYVSAVIVVVATALLALTGQWNLLWPAFGAANQLIAGIALLFASCWLLSRGSKYRLALVPAFFMLLTTMAALGLQFGRAAMKRDSASGNWSPDWVLGLVTALLIALAVSIMIDTLKTFRSLRTKPLAPS